MIVDSSDGSCRSCHRQLVIVDADDATMTVQCQNPACADEYLVETDAFGDGGLTYWPAFIAQQIERGCEEG